MKLDRLRILCLFVAGLFCLNMRAAGVIDQRVVNLIICNTNSETDDQGGGNPITTELSKALVENQLVLCTKKSWHLLQELSNKLKDDKMLYQNIREIEQLTKQFGKNPEKLYKKIKDFSQNIYINHKVDFYMSYEIIKARKYICKEVPGDFLLFVPRDLLNVSVSQEVLEVARQKNIHKNNLVVGLKFFDFPDYGYSKEAEVISYFGDIFQAIESLELRKDLNKDRVYELLPQMNILLFGHGEYGSTISEISIFDYPKLLNIFNQRYITKCLFVVSCFAGGTIQKFENLFKGKNNFEYLSYPIVVGSGLAASFSQSPFYVSHVSLESEQAVANSIYNINGTHFYGLERKWNDTGFYERLFEFLNHRSGNAFAPEYEKAAQLFGDQHGDIGENIQNLFAIRLANTASWFTLSGFREQVMEIGKTRSMNPGGILVSAKVKDLMLKTESVKNKIIIKGGIKEKYIIPGLVDKEFSGPVNYYIEELVVEGDGNIEDVVKSFFEEKYLERLEQSFVVFIKKVKIGGAEYSDMTMWFKFNQTGGGFRPLVDTRLAIYSYVEKDNHLNQKIVFYKKNKDLYVGDGDTIKAVNQADSDRWFEQLKNLANDIVHNQGNKAVELNYEKVANLFDEGRKSAKDVKKMQEDQKQKAKESWIKEGKSWSVPKENSRKELVEALELALRLK